MYSIFVNTYICKISLAVNNLKQNCCVAKNVNNHETLNETLQGFSFPKYNEYLCEIATMCCHDLLFAVNISLYKCANSL